MCLCIRLFDNISLGFTMSLSIFLLYTFRLCPIVYSNIYYACPACTHARLDVWGDEEIWNSKFIILLRIYILRSKINIWWLDSLVYCILYLYNYMFLKHLKLLMQLENLKYSAIYMLIMVEQPNFNNSNFKILNICILIYCLCIGIYIRNIERRRLMYNMYA